MVQQYKDWNDSYRNYKNYNMKSGLEIGTMEQLGHCGTVFEINV